VDSGGGWHCYWLLDEPHVLRNEADRKDAGELQGRFVLGIGGDGGAKDLARVLRLPGTLNAKYEPARKVEVIEDNRANTIYTFSEMCAWVNIIAPKSSPAAPSSTSPDSTKRAPEGIAGILAKLAAQSEGNRNSVLYWGAQRMRERSIPQTDAEAMLLPITQAIGLADAEATRTIASAYGGGR
jgi:hypothetical protein